MIEHRQRLYAAGAVGILAFIVAQTFQELPIDKARSVAILATIIVGDAWAHAYLAATTDPDRLAIVGRVTMLQQIEHGWFFVTMSSYLLGSVAFAVATRDNDAPWRRPNLARLPQ